MKLDRYSIPACLTPDIRFYNRVGAIDAKHNRAVSSICPRHLKRRRMREDRVKKKWPRMYSFVCVRNHG